MPGDRSPESDARDLKDCGAAELDRANAHQHSTDQDKHPRESLVLRQEINDAAHLLKCRFRLFGFCRSALRCAGCITTLEVPRPLKTSTGWTEANTA